ncbi:MAG: hypothetical protein JO035_07195 [Betaproteobacteria bacterium]|nr:hypothetical protein [Betaproteobacteria bacterium]
MTEKRILYFTGDGHAAYRCTRSALEHEASFTPDEPGLASFRAYVARHSKALFSFIADLAGEDFHEDQIPMLRGSDREAVVRRRLAQRYRDLRLAAALSLGSVSAGERKNERLLLASFSSPEQVTPWIDAIDEAGARLAGFYSVPLLAPALATRLGAKGGRAFVVTADRAGLRQCFVDEGKLRFGRLERVGEMTPQALSAFVRSETQRLSQYLMTLRALPREGAPVNVLVVAPKGQKAAFQRSLVSDARLAFHTVDIDEATDAVGLSELPAAAGAEALYLHLAAHHPPREQFASREDTRRYFFWKLQRGLVVAGAAAFAACALYAGNRWLQASQLETSAEQQAQQARQAASQYERITAGFPVTQTSTENLKVAVVEFLRIAERSPPPEAAFVHVSRVLEKFPQMDLEALTWSVGTPERRTEAKPAPSVAPPGKPGAGAELAVIVEIAGRVNATQRNDYRGITEQVQRFAGALASGGYELIRTQLPFDITSEGTLTGDIGGSETTDAPRFTIVVARRLP